MSKIKGCDRCRYKIIYHIDYRKSAQEQKIYYTTDKVCSKCNYIKCKSKYKEASLDNYPSDMNVDLSKIIHEHNHNKYCGYQHYKDIYDNDHNCIKSVLIKTYACDFCNKMFECTEIICEHIYDEIKYEIDYQKSARNKKIYYSEDKLCSKCKYRKLNYREAELDNYPKDMNVDLTKIIHKCNYDKVDYYKVPQYDYEGKCIELILYTYNYCSICDKEMSDKKEIYNLNNPCKLMNKLTKHMKKSFGNFKEAIEQHNKLIKWNEKRMTNYKRRKEARHEGDLRRFCESWKKDHSDYDYDNDYKSGASYDSKGGHYYSYHDDWCFYR